MPLTIGAYIGDKMKKTFYSELAYILGIIMLALGVAMMERGDFGMSMVVAPAYILHLKISEFLPFFSFGMATYCFEAALLILLCIIRRRVKLSYLFSFVTALIYGFILDGAVYLIGFIPVEGVIIRLVFFAVGLLLCTWGIAFLFKTYISPEAYEVFVMEITDMTGSGLMVIKTIYDLCSLALAVSLAFVFFGFGEFVGVNWGTLVCACLNGLCIGLFARLNDKLFNFTDGIPRLKSIMQK